MATPIVQEIEAVVPAQATAATPQSVTLGEAERDGSVSAVRFVPSAAITGQATNFRTFRVVNKGQDGTGNTVVATLAFSSGAVTAAANDEKDIPISAPATVVAGDVLLWDETVAGTGLASPGGHVEVQLTGWAKLVNPSKPKQKEPIVAQREKETKVNVAEPAQPGPDVSNADIGNDVSRLSTFSTTVPNPNPNPNGEVPEPGPSAVEYLGRPSGAAPDDEPDAGAGSDPA